MLMTCNSNCDCSTEIYNPVCGPDKVTTYFNPCYAGCQTSEPLALDSNRNLFSNCSCLNPTDTITDGYCEEDCSQNLKFYLAIISSTSIVGALGSTADMIIGIR